MGNKPSSPLAECLRTVCGDRTDCVAFPETPLYQVSWVKPYNLDIPIEPAAVFRPLVAEDVSRAIKCAARSDYKVQARSGGHSYGNYGLGGEDGVVVIDMINMKQFEIDETTWFATAGPGHLLNELDEKLHNSGKRAIAHGICPSVGLGGHATIGGLGAMSRMWGSTLDHVVEVEVVTADGKIQRASEDENSDLFFALRGAGASFGVITEFVLRTHPEPGTVVEYSYHFSFGRHKDMAKVWKQWQDVIIDPQMDKRFSTLFIAQPLGALITGTFYGTEDEFKKTGIPDKMPAGGEVVVNVTDWLGGLAHEAETSALVLSGLPTPFYSKSLAFREEDKLPASAIDDVFSFIDSTDRGTLVWFIIWDSTGGVINTPSNSSSYPHRDKLFFYQSYAVGLPKVSDNTRKFLEGVHDRIKAGAPDAQSAYAGYVDPAFSSEEGQSLYWGAKLGELRRVKREWDPKDIFHNPQSVAPAQDQK